MLEVMRFAHEFLQAFCLGNHANQKLLHKRIELFLTPGVRCIQHCTFMISQINAN